MYKILIWGNLMGNFVQGKDKLFVSYFVQKEKDNLVQCSFSNTSPMK